MLSPTKKGHGGTLSLNLVLQPILNPPETGKAEIPLYASLRRNAELGDPVWRVGDRVVQTVNNYDKVGAS